MPLVVIDDDDDLVDARARRRHAGDPRQRASTSACCAKRAGARARIALLAIPERAGGGRDLARLRELNPALTILARAHSDAEVKHLLEHGADGAVMAERELAHSLAEMVMATPPYRGARRLPPAVAILIPSPPPLHRTAMPAIRLHPRPPCN